MTTNYYAKGTGLIDTDNSSVQGAGARIAAAANATGVTTQAERNAAVARAAAEIAATAGTEQLHIGQHARGWTFLLHVFEPGSQLPTDLNEWLELLARDGVTIEDEYGQEVSYNDMVAMITVPPSADEVFLRRRGNDTTPGNGPWCMARGEFC